MYFSIIINFIIFVYFILIILIIKISSIDNISLIILMLSIIIYCLASILLYEHLIYLPLSAIY